MPMIHDAAFRDQVRSRLGSLRAELSPRWGTMTADQMLWHVSATFENALGRYAVAPVHIPLPRALVKFLVITVPWRKGKTRTAPEFIARERYDFEQERVRMLALIDEVASRPLAGPWRDSPFMGPMTGTDWSRLMGKHIDYHLRQFGL